MCEAYAAQQLSMNTSEEGWKEWASGLKAIDVFVNEGIPGPYNYQNWQDWAQAAGSLRLLAAEPALRCSREARRWDIFLLGVRGR
jgi:hypothetical protein